MSQATKGFLIVLQSFFAEFEHTAKGLRQVASLEDMCCLNEWLAVHDLRDQVLVDLTQTAIEHLTTLEHVEDAIREHWLIVAVAIDVEKKFTGRNRRVHCKFQC